MQRNTESLCDGTGRNGVTAGMTVSEPAGRSRQAAGSEVRQAEIRSGISAWIPLGSLGADR